MQKILEEGRQSILSDERKSGVIAPISGGGGTATSGKSGDPLNIRR